MEFNNTDEVEDFDEQVKEALENAEDLIDVNPEETSRNRLADKGLKEIYEGIENIKDCINNPLDSRLEQVGINALQYVVSSYHARDSGLEKSLRDKDDERVLVTRRQETLLSKLSEEQTQLISTRVQLRGLKEELLRISNDDYDITKRLKLRSLQEEVATYEAMEKSGEEQVAKYRVSVPRIQAEYDAVLREVDDLANMASQILYGPEVMLLCAPNYVINTDVDLPYITSKISDEIESGIVPTLKEQLNKIKLFKDDGKESGFALFSGSSYLPQSLKTHGEERSLLSGPLLSSYNSFKNSEIGKVIHNINVNALFMQEFRGEKFDTARQNEIIMKDPIKTLDTSLMNEMYFINLTCMSGYDPITWARCFGVPISGIGKQILKGWRSGGKRPMNADGLRKLFLEGEISKEHNMLLDVNKLEYSVSTDDKMKEKLDAQLKALNNTQLITEQVKAKIRFDRLVKKGKEEL
jgi:hypothetical protein